MKVGGNPLGSDDTLPQPVSQQLRSRIAPAAQQRDPLFVVGDVGFNAAREIIGCSGGMDFEIVARGINQCGEPVHRALARGIRLCSLFGLVDDFPEADPDQSERGGDDGIRGMPAGQMRRVVDRDAQHGRDQG